MSMDLEHTKPLNFTTSRPIDQSIVQSERVELQCFVRSSLTPTFMWNFKRKGKSPQLIVDGHNPLSSDYLLKLGRRSQVLIIKKVRWIQGGVYKCIVSTDNSTIQAEANLDVLSKYNTPRS